MFELVYNEEKKEWEQKPEPYVTIDVATKEDYDFLRAAVDFYEKHTAKDTNVLTNADHIRAMSDEELAKFLETRIAGCPDPARNCRASCTDCILDWLRRPVKEE